MPDPASVICDVNYHMRGGDHIAGRFRLPTWMFGPQDVLAMADISSTPQKGELETRILLAAALPADATDVAIDFAPALRREYITFPDAFFLAKSFAR